MSATLFSFRVRDAWRAFAVALLALWLACAASAVRAADDFLPPEEAFRFSARVAAPGEVEVQFRIAPGYYMYREQFRISAEPDTVALGEPRIPRGELKYDETFQKEVESMRDTVRIAVPVPADAGRFTLLVRGQGCADAGLCYPPQDYRATVALASGQVDDGSGFMAGIGRLLGANDVGLSDAIAGQGVAQTVLAFFVLGILLALTPCVLPMVPILMSILAGDRSATTRPRLRGLGLAASYVLGMSLVYTVAGVLAGLSGESLAAALQTPWILSIFAAMLVVFALAMFDVFTLQVPSGWQTALSARMARIPGGRATGTFAMGAVSALIVGPCVAAPLAGALLYISQTRDVVLGGTALFALAWGMGVPLLLAGASAGSLLPRAGAWMDGVKRFFGVLLLAVAWWMLMPVLPAWLLMAGWAALAILAATMLHAFEALPAGAGAGARMGKALGILFALAGVLLAVGLASGGRDPLQPLAHLARSESSTPALPQASTGVSPWASADTPAPTGSLPPSLAQTLGTSGSGGASVPEGTAHFTRVRTLAELNAVVANADRPVMLDFYADWCVSCKEMERFTFSDSAVAAQMDRMLVVQADVTKNDEADRELLKRFRLFGPPGIIFFAPGGRELHDARVIGFQNARRFGAVLETVLATPG